MLGSNASSEWQVDINNRLDRTCAGEYWECVPPGTDITWDCVLLARELMGSVKPAFLVWFLFIHSFEMVAHCSLNWPAIYCAGLPQVLPLRVWATALPSPSLASAFKELTWPWLNHGKAVVDRWVSWRNPRKACLPLGVSSTLVFSHLGTGAIHRNSPPPRGSQETLSHSAPSPDTAHTCCKWATVAEVQWPSAPEGSCATYREYRDIVLLLLISRKWFVGFYVTTGPDLPVS